jgi:flagellar motor switch protein FliN
MAGDPQSLNQDDIEELLRQAQLASGLVGEAASAGGTAAKPSSEKVSDEQALESPHPTTAATAEHRPWEQSRVPAGGASNPIGDDVQFLLAQAEQAIASVDQPASPDLAGLAPFELKDLAGTPASGEKATIELLKDVDLDLRIELGRTQMYLEDVLKLKRGSVVALDKLAGDPVDVFVNGRLVARGEVLVLNDNFCVRVTELLAGDDFD